MPPQMPLLCRRWMKVVLQPLNERAADVVVNHVDLLRTPYIDPLLLQASRHCWDLKFARRAAAPAAAAMPAADVWLFEVGLHVLKWDGHI